MATDADSDSHGAPFTWEVINEAHEDRAFTLDQDGSLRLATNKLNYRVSISLECLFGEYVSASSSRRPVQANQDGGRISEHRIYRSLVFACFRQMWFSFDTSSGVWSFFWLRYSLLMFSIKWVVIVERTKVVEKKRPGATIPTSIAKQMLVQQAPPPRRAGSQRALVPKPRTLIHWLMSPRGCYKTRYWSLVKLQSFDFFHIFAWKCQLKTIKLLQMPLPFSLQSKLCGSFKENWKNTWLLRTLYF